MFCWCESGISEKIQGKLILIQVISLRLEKLDCTVHSFQICVNCCYIYVGGGGGGGGGLNRLLPISFTPASCPFPIGFLLFGPFSLQNITKCCEFFSISPSPCLGLLLPIPSSPAASRLPPLFSWTPALLSPPTYTGN